MGPFYFVADNGTEGRVLWKSDGTTEGTVVVKDLEPASNDLSVASPVVIGNIFYFRSTTQGNTRLWKTDGTAEGTVFMKDRVFITMMTELNGIVYFIEEHKILLYTYGRVTEPRQGLSGENNSHYTVAYTLCGR